MARVARANPPTPSARHAALMSAGRIGTLDLPNRIIVTAMGVSLANDDGTVSDRLLDYHVRRRGAARA